MWIAIALLQFWSPATDLGTVRSTYKDALNNSAKADKLVEQTQSKRTTSGTYRAYYGTGLALQAKHSWNPATKIAKAKEAATELNSAVKAAPKDLEVRFLRFSYEVNVPSVVGITKHLSEDKSFILSNLNKSNPIWTTIKSFLLSCSELTSAEKEKVKKV